MRLTIVQALALIRFFRVVPPLPALLVSCFAVTVAVAVLAAAAGVTPPGTAVVPVLLLQLFAAASGFAAPARRGYFDLLLTQGEARLHIAAAHWTMSIAPGLAAWLLIGGLEAALGTRRVALASGTAAAFALVSTLPWAITVALPRFAGAIGWLLVLVTMTTMVPESDVPPWLHFLVYPPGVVGRDVLLVPLTVVPALTVAVGAMVAAVAWIARMDVPLEASQ